MDDVTKVIAEFWLATFETLEGHSNPVRSSNNIISHLGIHTFLRVRISIRTRAHSTLFIGISLIIVQSCSQNDMGDHISIEGHVLDILDVHTNWTEVIDSRVSDMNIVRIFDVNTPTETIMDRAVDDI